MTVPSYMTTTRTKFNQSEAARIVGRARNTIAAHIKSGRLSAEHDAQGNLVIDQSELLRVYSDECDFSRVDAPSTTGAKDHPPVAQNNGQGLFAQLSMTEQLLESQKEERRRERERLEAEIGRLEQLLHKAEERQNKITLMLEDRTRGIGGFENSFQALERRVTEQGETLHKKLEEAEQQANRYKKAYHAEKSKTVWQKLFG